MSVSCTHFARDFHTRKHSQRSHARRCYSTVQTVNCWVPVSLPHPLRSTSTKLCLTRLLFTSLAQNNPPFYRGKNTHFVIHFAHGNTLHKYTHTHTYTNRHTETPRHTHPSMQHLEDNFRFLSNDAKDFCSHSLCHYFSHFGTFRYSQECKAKRPHTHTHTHTHTGC